MPKYRLICPECSAALFTAYPEAVVWEVCPACGKYTWDLYDARMADLIAESHRHRQMIMEHHEDN